MRNDVDSNRLKNAGGDDLSNVLDRTDFVPEDINSSGHQNSAIFEHGSPKSLSASSEDGHGSGIYFLWMTWTDLNPVGFEVFNSRVRSDIFVIRMVDDILGTAMNSRRAGGLTIGLPYSKSPTMMYRSSDWAYAYAKMTAAYGSDGAGALKFSKADIIAEDWLIVYTFEPPHNSPWGNVKRSKRVTIPKLFPPPLRAK